MSEKKKDKIKRITESWGELEEIMGEMAALEVACQEEGVDSEWYFENLD